VLLLCCLNILGVKGSTLPSLFRRIPNPFFASVFDKKVMKTPLHCDSYTIS
jgi:hypothetical protein